MYVGAPSLLLKTSMVHVSPLLAVKAYQSRSRRFSTWPAISHGRVTSWALSAVSLAPLSSTTGAEARANRNGLDDPEEFLTRSSKPSSVTADGSRVPL